MCGIWIGVNPPGLTTQVDAYSFMPTGLETVTIPDSVTLIGASAFSGCSALSIVILPDSVVSVGANALGSCFGFGLAMEIMPSVTDDYNDYTYAPPLLGTVQCLPCANRSTIAIIDTVVYIEGGAFESCTSLVNASIPDSVIGLGSASFRGCSALGQIQIPASITTIGSNAFHSCTTLHEVALPQTVLAVGSYAFASCSALVTVSSLGSINVLPTGLFSSCARLQAINLPTLLTAIEPQAFEGCVSLETIVLPNSVSYIGTAAFRFCNVLNFVNFPQSITMLGSEAFHGCSQLTNVTIPPTTRTLYTDTFYGCTFCTSASFDTFVDGISSSGVLFDAIIHPPPINITPSYAYYNCDNLGNVTLSDTIHTIQSYAITFASNLDNVTIPDSVATIEPYAFQGCSGLASIRIPPSVNVSADAFVGCSCTKTLYRNGTALRDCVPGYLSVANTWTAYTACTKDAFQSTPGSYTADAQCTMLTVCDPTTQFVSTAASDTSDRRCSTRPRTLSTADKMGIGIGVVVLCVGIGAVGVHLYKKRKRTEKDLHMHVRLLEDERAENQTLYAENIEMKRAWEIDESDVDLEEQMASGAFGAVWRGRWGHIAVAVKMLKQPLDDATLGGDDFHREVSFMQKIRHPNLLIFYGAGVTAQQLPFLVVELMAEGSMRNVLRSARALTCAQRQRSGSAWRWTLHAACGTCIRWAPFTATSSRTTLSSCTRCGSRWETLGRAGCCTDHTTWRRVAVRRWGRPP